MTYSVYYQAYLESKMTWLVTGALRNESGWAFDRTLEPKSGLVEFLVAPNYEPEFLHLMEYFSQQGYVKGLVKLPNRYALTS